MPFFCTVKNCINFKRMIPGGILCKLLPPRPQQQSDLLSPTGGACSHAYFQYQHYHHHHHHKVPSSFDGHHFPTHCTHFVCTVGGKVALPRRPITCCPSLQSNTTPSDQSSLNQETKEKLESLKQVLAQNVYYEKYKDKFRQLELTSPRELLAKLENLAGTLPPKSDGKIGDKAGSRSSSKQHVRLPLCYQANFEEVGLVTKWLTIITIKDDLFTSVGTQFILNDVMELDRIQNLDREDVIFLWQEFHRKKEGLLGAVMAGGVFDKMAHMGSKYSMFLLPLPRSNGYEFMLVQYSNKAFHFTPLLAYQTHKENAPECFRLINYTDLQASKDLVLMRGEFDKNLLTLKEAHVLAVQVNFYYGETSESRSQLIEAFSRKGDFSHMDLIEELKRLQESHKHLFEFEEV